MSDVLLSLENFKMIVVLVHDLTGITVQSDRLQMIESRLLKRLRALNIQDFSNYLKVVNQNLDEQAQFINAITTNETSFYRTPRIWLYIEEKILPKWHSAKRNKVFKVWSAASSSGEEACTAALICNYFQTKNPNFAFSIFGTDISTSMIQKCVDGAYSPKSLASLKQIKPELFENYFTPKSDTSFEILESIKSKIIYKQHNLFLPHPTTEKYDLILLRNVLIYFSQTDQEKVISIVTQQLNDKGVLIIGESESLTYIKNSLNQLEPLIYEHMASENFSKVA